MYVYVSHAPPGIQTTRSRRGNRAVWGSPLSRTSQFTAGSRKQDCNTGDLNLQLAQGAAHFGLQPGGPIRADGRIPARAWPQCDVGLAAGALVGH
eukprot:7315026-Pyramimonas_sp.AAC.1